MKLAGRIGILAAALVGVTLVPLAPRLGSGATDRPAAGNSNSARAVPAGSGPATPIILPPLPPSEISPITFFRGLLVMNEAERVLALSGYTPGRQAQILTKVHEYELLSPD